MAIPGSAAPAIAFVSPQYTVTEGITPPAPQQSIPVYNLPIDQPTYLLGVDAQPFSFTLNGAGLVTAEITVAFPALPVRNNSTSSINAKNTQTDPLSILSGSRLIMIVGVQGLAIPGDTLANVTADAQAITTDNIYLPGPFLGSGKFRTFQAVIDVSATNFGTLTDAIVSGYVWAVLYLASA
jgi:hypothetical protein